MRNSEKYPPPMPSGDRLRASLVALVKRLRADGRRSTRPDRTARLREEYADEILALVGNHLLACATVGNVAPQLREGIRAWLVARPPAAAPGVLVGGGCEVRADDAPGQQHLDEILAPESCAHGECGA